MHAGGHDEPHHQVNLLRSVRTLATTLIEVAATRLEILTVELQEESLRLAKIVAWSALTVFFAGLVVVFLSFLVVAANWDDHRIAALTAVAVFHAVLGGMTGLLLYRQLGRKSQLFSTSLQELRKDESELRAGSPEGSATLLQTADVPR